MSIFYKNRFFAYIYLIFNRAYFDSKTMFLLTILSEIQKMKRFYVMKNYKIIIIVVVRQNFFILISYISIIRFYRHVIQSWLVLKGFINDTRCRRYDKNKNYNNIVLFRNQQYLYIIIFIIMNYEDNNIIILLQYLLFHQL